MKKKIKIVDKCYNLVKTLTQPSKTKIIRLLLQLIYLFQRLCTKYFPDQKKARRPWLFWRYVLWIAPTRYAFHLSNAMQNNAKYPPALRTAWISRTNHQNQINERKNIKVFILIVIYFTNAIKDNHIFLFWYLHRKDKYLRGRCDYLQNHL